MSRKQPSELRQELLQLTAALFAVTLWCVGVLLFLSIAAFYIGVICQVAIFLVSQEFADHPIFFVPAFVVGSIAASLTLIFIANWVKRRVHQRKYHKSSRRRG